MSDPVKTIDDAWKRQGSPELWAEIDRLNARIALAERLIDHLNQHEGAEGWSDYLKAELDEWYGEQEEPK